jgi:hypothetical protein
MKTIAEKIILIRELSARYNKNLREKDFEECRIENNYIILLCEKEGVDPNILLVYRDVLDIMPESVIKGYIRQEVFN